MHEQSRNIERLHAAGYGFQRGSSLMELEGLLASETCIVAHFYDPYSEADARLDLVLMDLATTYVGTIFVRINCEEMAHAPTGLTKALRFTGKVRQGLVCCRGGDVVTESRSDYVEFMSQGVVYAGDVASLLEPAGALPTEPPEIFHTEQRRTKLQGAGVATPALIPETARKGED